jgi:hypothetical protein
MKLSTLSSTVAVALFTLAPLVALTAPSTASAQASADYRCTDLQVQARTAAAAASDAGQIQRAQRFIATGRQLCEANAEGQAARQFRSALRILGVQEIRNPAPSQIATSGTAATGGN